MLLYLLLGIINRLKHLLCELYGENEWEGTKMSLGFLIENFFTHKDFLPPASELWGTMFTPLHFAFAAFWLALVIFFGIYVGKRSERTIKRVFLVLWIFLVTLEIGKMIWESCAGNGIKFEWGGVIPLYPCSIFMYAFKAGKNTGFKHSSSSSENKYKISG